MDVIKDGDIRVKKEKLEVNHVVKLRIDEIRRLVKSCIFELVNMDK